MNNFLCSKCESVSQHISVFHFSSIELHNNQMRKSIRWFTKMKLFFFKIHSIKSHSKCNKNESDLAIHWQHKAERTVTCTRSTTTNHMQNKFNQISSFYFFFSSVKFNSRVCVFYYWRWHEYHVCYVIFDGLTSKEKVTYENTA